MRLERIELIGRLRIVIDHRSLLSDSTHRGVIVPDSAAPSQLSPSSLSVSASSPRRAYA
jgi:hypothetical protein